VMGQTEYALADEQAHRRKLLLRIVKDFGEDPAEFVNLLGGWRNGSPVLRRATVDLELDSQASLERLPVRNPMGPPLMQGHGTREANQNDRP